MAKGKKKQNLSPEELLEQALVPEDEQPYEVPKNWVWTRMGHIIQLISGRDVISSLCNDQGKGIPYILGASNLDGDNFIAERWIEKPEVVSISGDILLSVKGTIGKIYLQKEPEINISRQIMALRSSRATNKLFLKFYLEHICDLLKAAGNGLIPGISREDILLREYPLPPLAEQQRIVDRIESLCAKLDQAKELVQNALDSFESRKAAILHKAFTGELTAKWRENNPSIMNTVLEDIANFANNLPKKDREKILEGQTLAKSSSIQNWYNCTIGAIGIVTNGSTPSRKINEYWNGEIPWVSSGEVKNNLICSTTEKITRLGYENSSVKLLPPGTVLIAMIGEGKTRGQSAILEIEATTNQNVAAIILDHGFVSPRFLWYWLQKEYQKNREKGNGTGPQALNCQRVRELEFVVPPFLEQQEIVRILDSLFEKEREINELVSVISKIDLIKKSILSRAFRGELGTNDETDEPALELLKKVLVNH